MSCGSHVDDEPFAPMDQLANPEDGKNLVNARWYHVEQSVEKFAVVSEIDVKTALPRRSHATIDAATHLRRPLAILVDGVDLGRTQTLVAQNRLEKFSHICAEDIVQ